MNLETINKWLDEEYGCSFTKLEELHDWLVEENIKLRDENQQLKHNRDKAIRTLETLKGSARWERHLYEVDYILDILKGDSDD